MNLIRLTLKRSSIGGLVLRTILSIGLCILICELIIPFIYLFNCDWPDSVDNFSLRSVVLSDTHLFGFRRRYYFIDKLKREWNMHIAYQLAILIFQPNSILILGDIFDEGLIANKQEFAKYSEKFFQLFPLPKDVDLTVSVGNHDVGFHDRMVYFPGFLDRFENFFNLSLVQLKNVNGINVVNVNSMAMQGDHCDLCSLAQYQIEEISSKLFERCDSKKSTNKKLCKEQRPILISHFPLHRVSDLDCNEPDSNYDNSDEKSNIIPKRSCISKKATNFLLKNLQPKLALNGNIF